MASLDPYTLAELNDIVPATFKSYESMHAVWRVLQRIYATGDLRHALYFTGERLTQDMLFELRAVNLTLPYINTIISAVTAHDPRFVAAPYDIGSLDADRITKQLHTGALLEYQWERGNGTEALKAATKDLVILGNGFLKTGWLRREYQMLRKVDEIEGDVSAMEIDEYDAALIEEREPTSRAELVDMVPKLKDCIEERAYINRVSPFNIAVDHNATTLEDARWVCERIVRPVDELRANEAYNQSVDIVPLTSQQYRNTTAQQLNAASGSLVAEDAEIFEFHDLATGRLVVFQRDASSPLFDDFSPYMHVGAPYVQLKGFSEDDSEFWGFGDLLNIATIQHMYNQVAKAQIDHTKAALNVAYFVEDSDPNNTSAIRSALTEYEPNKVVPVSESSDGRSVSDRIHTFQAAPVPSAVYDSKNDLESAIVNILDLNDFQTGGSGADRMAATTAAVMDGIASQKAAMKVAVIERGLSKLAKLVLFNMQAYMTEEAAVRVSGNGAQTVVRMTSDDIQGEYDVRVEGGSTQAVNPATKSNRALQVLRDIVPLITDLGGDPTQMIRQALVDLGWDPDTVLPDGVNPPQPEPAPEQMMPAAGALPPGMPAGMPPGMDPNMMMAPPELTPPPPTGAELPPEMQQALAAGMEPDRAGGVASLLGLSPEELAGGMADMARQGGGLAL